MLSCFVFRVPGIDLWFRVSCFVFRVPGSKKLWGENWGQNLRGVIEPFTKRERPGDAPGKLAEVTGREAPSQI